MKNFLKKTSEHGVNPFVLLVESDRRHMRAVCIPFAVNFLNFLSCTLAERMKIITFYSFDYYYIHIIDALAKSKLTDPLNFFDFFEHFVKLLLG